MRGILRLVETLAGAQGKNMLAGAVAALKLDLADINGPADIESLQLRFAQDSRRINMVHFFAFDLREEANFRIKMEGCRGRGRTDQDRPLKPHDLLAPQAAQQIDKLVEQHVDELAKARVAIFGA